MRRIAIYFQAVVLTLATSFSFPQTAAAQSRTKPNKGETSQRLEKLLEERSREHWGLETQLKPTSPPRSQPVRTLPEWYPAGGVLLTLDDSYSISFVLNQFLNTEGKGAEITRRAPGAAAYIKAAGCNLLYSALRASQESVQRNSEITGDINSLCHDVPASERKGLTLPWESTKQAEDWLHYVYYKLIDGSLSEELSYAHSFLRIVKSFAPHTKVFILVPVSPDYIASGDALYDWLAIIRSFPGGSELLDTKNVQFVQLPVKTRWVRDYGPIFIRSAEGHILCVDSRYNTERVSIEDKRLKTLFESMLKNDKAATKEQREDNRLFDDVSPSFLAARLRQKRGRSLLPNPVNVVRPPIALDGGDFFTDGNGIGFTSTKTLQLNGGDLELLNQVFKEYFGLKEMIYLRPLPGRTVQHIDMFFKVVSQDIILLGRFGPSDSSNVAAPMQAEAQRIMDYNLKVLRDFYENRRVKVNVINSETDSFQKNAINIILVPMPDLLRPAREQVARMEQYLVRLTEERAQHAKAAQNALAENDSLGNSIKFLHENYNTLENIIGRLQASGSAKSIKLSHLQTIAARMAPALKALQEKHGKNAKLIDWQGSHRRMLELSIYLDSQKGSAERKLGSNDRRVLALYLRNYANALQAIISGLQSYSSGIKRLQDEHTGEAARVAELQQLGSEQKKILEQQLPYSTDIYRTFLNALQVKTNKANLLLVPSYSKLDATEKRAQAIFRRVYTRVYGNVNIIPIDSDYFIQQSGSIHCLAQTLPAEVDVFSDR